MCGVSAVVNLRGEALPSLARRLAHMNDLLRHRGPDGGGMWMHERGHAGFGHRRLAVIDLETGAQPMTNGNANWITYNGEVYNYIELRDELGLEDFRTTSDVEVVLRAYDRWGTASLQR